MPILGNFSEVTSWPTDPLLVPTIAAALPTLFTELPRDLNFATVHDHAIKLLHRCVHLVEQTRRAVHGTPCPPYVSAPILRFGPFARTPTRLHTHFAVTPVAVPIAFRWVAIALLRLIAELWAKPTEDSVHESDAASLYVLILLAFRLHCVGLHMIQPRPYIHYGFITYNGFWIARNKDNPEEVIRY